MEDLDEAMLLCTALLAFVPHTHPQPSMIVNDSSLILTEKFKANKEDASCINFAIEVLSEAKELTDSSHFTYPRILHNLVLALKASSTVDGTTEGTGLYADLLLELWQCDTSLPSPQIDAAVEVASTYLASGNTLAAAELLSSAIARVLTIIGEITER